MGKALYRKYRSKSLGEVVGQEHITRALDNALKSGAISHAYLFTGPRGVGKTSIARILAHEVNGFAYDETSTHVDIIEIDAASNRRIDEVRDLRDKVHVVPSYGKYKVYIIDEVHMLTREAFNALLKTLEEPPAHVIFILATTEAHKLPETIISRTQHYAFRTVPLPQVTAHLAEIAQRENIAISGEALDLVARHGEGSFRDSISLLDQVRSYGDSISLGDVEAVLGVAPEDGLRQLLTLLASGTAAEVVVLLQALQAQGVDAVVIARQLGALVRGTMLEGTSSLGSDASLTLLEKLLSVPSSPNPAAALELALLHTVFARAPFSPAQVETAPQPPIAPQPLAEPAPETAKPAAQPAPKPKATKPAEKAKAEPAKATTSEPAAAPTASPRKHAPEQPFDVGAWPEVLGHIKKKHNTLYGMLRMAEASSDNGALILSFSFPFHQKRANDQKNKQVIIEAVQAVTGAVVAVSCVVSEAPAKPAIAPVAEPDPSIAAISNIFGSAEVLES